MSGPGPRVGGEQLVLAVFSTAMERNRCGVAVVYRQARVVLLSPDYCQHLWLQVSLLTQKGSLSHGLGAGCT